MPATLVNAQADYAGALSLAKDAYRMQAAKKNVAKLALLDTLRKLSSLVNFTAVGNRILLLSSGFDISKDIANPVVIKPAKNAIVNYSANSGEMYVAVKGNKGLVFECSVSTTNNGLTQDSTYTRGSMQHYTMPKKPYCAI